MIDGNAGNLLDAGVAADRHSCNELVELVYRELRQLAAWHLKRERPGHTLQPTALVHEAYLRLACQQSSRWKSRTHFLAVAAQQMRRVLVDHARRQHAVKRGGTGSKISLFAIADFAGGAGLDVVRLDDALISLSQMDSRQATIVDLRFFGAMTVEETAEALGISPATVKRDWEVAKLWLYRELEAGGA